MYVDPHVLATPLLVDLNGDSMQELIIPVTYYFDRFVHLPDCAAFRRVLTHGPEPTSFTPPQGNVR